MMVKFFFKENWILIVCVWVYSFICTYLNFSDVAT